MKKLALTAGLLALLTSGAARAAGWSGDVRISAIEALDVHGRPGVWLRFQSEPFSSHTCFQKGGKYRLWVDDAETLKQMNSMAVSALLASRPVKVLWWDTCDDDGYPILRGLVLR